MDRWLDRVAAREKIARKENGPSSSLPTVVDLFAELPAPRPKFMTELWDRLATTLQIALPANEPGVEMAIAALVTNPDTIRVLIVEPEPLLRRGLAGALAASDCMQVVGSVGTAAEGYRLADDVTPDVTLVGTTLIDATGLACAKEMRRRFPSLAVVVMSSHESDDELFHAIMAGAAAYCGKDIAEERLIELIERCATGEYVINSQFLDRPYVASRVLDQFRTISNVDAVQKSAFAPLTDRELEILRKISDGLTNTEIGYDLGISAQTVKNHITSILRKLAVNDRTHAVVTALRKGWISLND